MVAPKFASQKIVDSARSQPKYETLLVSTENNITTIMLNRPGKKNAINYTMGRELMQVLEDAGRDDSAITVLTGSGDYFCSGVDISNLLSTGKLEQMMGNKGEELKRFVGLFIDFPKPLIAVVNGHAVGMPVTLLGLCDVVYATEKATFQTPFNLLGLTPEGCSTMTFPAIMGPAKATEVLLFSKALTAREACTLGLVTQVFPDGTFQSQVWKKLKSYAQRPKESLALSKQLIRGAIKEKLHTANSREYECISGRMYSGEFLNAVQNYFQKRSKL